MTIIILTTIWLIWLVLMMSWRRVVPTNEYHIVQRSNKTIEYGKDRPAGNSYYAIPSFIPIFWVNVQVMPWTIFDITINNYDAFDSGRVPFMVDIAGFFRIDNPAIAAQRIKTIDELNSQLEAIVSSVARTILGKMDINDILETRSSLWDSFMEEISKNVREFGLVCTKNIELMKIYDAPWSSIIYNIQKKKESQIERDAKISIAENNKEAREKEIASERAIELARIDKEKQVGEADAENRKIVEIARQQAEQQINVEKKETIARELEAKMVQETKEAEIAKQKKIIEEEQEKSVKVIKAEAEAETLKKIAEGRKAAAKNDAEATIEKAKAESEAIQKKATAEAEGEKAKKEATVADQVKLLQEISKNQEYSKYLQAIKAIEMFGLAEQKKAEALQKADIKYLATGSENKYGEFLGKLGLGMETFKEFGGVENIKTLIDTVMSSVKSKEVKKEKDIEVEEVEVVDEENVTKTKKNK